MILGRKFFILALGFSRGRSPRQNPPPLVREFALVRGFSRSDQKYYCSNKGGAPKLALGRRLVVVGLLQDLDYLLGEEEQEEEVSYQYPSPNRQGCPKGFVGRARVRSWHPSGTYPAVQQKENPSIKQPNKATRHYIRDKVHPQVNATIDYNYREGKDDNRVPTIAKGESSE